MRATAVLGLVVLFAAFAGVQPTAAATIVVTPSLTTIGIATPFDVELVVLGLGDGVAPSVGAFDLDVSFDPGILSFVGGTLGDPILGDQLDLFALGSLSAITPGAGTVNIFELSLDLAADLDSMQPDSFTLATLTFEGIGVGVSSIGLSGFGLSDSVGVPIAAAFEGGVVEVPEAPPALLVAFGLMVGGISRLRALLPSS